MWSVTSEEATFPVTVPSKRTLAPSKSFFLATFIGILASS